MKRSQKITYSGLCILLSVLLQLAPIYFPTIGMLLSPLSSLPIILISIRSPLFGFGAWMGTSILLFCINPQEAAIFLCATGLFGLSFGSSYNFSKVLKVIIPSCALFLGLITLLFLLNVPALGPLSNMIPYILVPSIVAFCIIYNFVWVLFIRFIQKKFLTRFECWQS